MEDVEKMNEELQAEAEYAAATEDDVTEAETVVAVIVEENYQNCELPVRIYLFQGLPKSDKMEFIIQKAVDLGVYAVVPTEMTNCVVKLDDKKKKSKTFLSKKKDQIFSLF